MVSTRGSTAISNLQPPAKPRLTRNFTVTPPPQPLVNNFPAPIISRIHGRGLETPTPPFKLFRTVKELSAYQDSAVYLCLPRRFDSTLNDNAANNDASPAKENCLVLNSANMSDLGEHHLTLLPQLFVVKMHTNTNPDPIRHESNILSYLEKITGSERYIGSSLLREQFTDCADLSYICLRPIFGRNLRDFGEQVFKLKTKPIPTYFVWHVFLGLVGAIEFVHEAGITHNDVSMSSVMLDPFPLKKTWQYKDYPNVVLIGFAHASTLTRQGAISDVRSVLSVICNMAQEFSDSSALMNKAGTTAENDSLLNFDGEAREILEDESAEPTLAGVKKKWEKTALGQRAKGPKKLPEDLGRFVQSSLATAEQLSSACKAILKFEVKKDNFANLVRGDEWMDLDEQP